MSADADTLPPPPSDDEQTRDVRRIAFLTAATEPALVDLSKALASADAPVPRARSVLAYHLGLAWDDGAAREADLRTAIAVLRAEVRAYREDFSALHQEIIELRAEVARLRAQLERHRSITPRPEDTP